MEKNAKIYVAGHRGLVGSAIMRALKSQGYLNLVTRSREELNLTDQKKVEGFFAAEKPDYVFLAAAKVGGILANDTLGGDFIYENLTIQNNVLKEAHRHGVKKLLFLGSSCIYPRDCPQPIKEEYFLTGLLEPTNEAYATAKIAGIMMCKAFNKQYGTKFISAMPTNIYGPNDNFDPLTSHALPGIMKKIHDAKGRNESAVRLWGTGNPKREFLFVDDLAEACIFLMENFEPAKEKNIFLNIGTGQDVSISELAELIKEIVDFKGTVIWDRTKPDGVSRKLLDVTRIHELGWRHKTELREGTQKTYDWFVNSLGK